MQTIRKISAEMWRNLELTLVWAYRRPIPSHSLDSSSDIRNLSAWLILQGGVHVIKGKTEIEAKAGDWVLLGSGPHRRIFQRKSHLLSLHFQMTWLTGRPVFAEEMKLVLPAEDYPLLQRAGGNLERFVCRRFKHPGLDLLLTPLALKDYLRMQELFVRWIDAYTDAVTKAGLEMNFPVESDERVYRTLQILSKWPLHLPYDEAQIVAAAALSPSHLNRIFLTELGLTPRKFFENRKLEYVKRQLRLPNATIKEIAASIGFVYLGNFSKWFHRLEGMSPRAFQKGNGAMLLT
jgi:AraC-like DNA-binding protein